MEARNHVRGDPWGNDAPAVNGLSIRTNFAIWFGKSRVVDDQGNPQVFFHATKGDFDSFRPTSTGLKLMDGMGTHFGSIKAAHDRLRKSYGKETEGANILPVLLCIEKYPTLSSGAVMSETQLQAWLTKVAIQAGIDKHKTRAYSSAYPLRGDIFTRVKAALVERGFDGLAYLNSHEDRGSVSYVAFEPHQVKSAIGNSGLFTHTNSLTDQVENLTLSRGQRARQVVCEINEAKPMTVLTV